MVEPNAPYPLITVVIPTYNSQNELEVAIKSVQSQLFLNWELLIIDGGSSDNTLDIIRNYANNDARISYVSEKDNGVYDAMNKGISLARGEWIYFLGSDDKLYAEKVFSVVAQMLKHAPGQFVYGNVKMGDRPEKYDGPFEFSKLLIKNIPHQASFYKKELFKKFGLYDQRYRQHADWALNIKCFRQVDPLYIDVIVGLFGLGGISGAHDELFLREVLLPEKMNLLKEEGKHVLRNIRSYDIVWRMMRNAAFKDEQDFEHAFLTQEVPMVIKSMFHVQRCIPVGALKNGFVSKTLMTANYLYNRIIFRL